MWKYEKGALSYKTSVIIIQCDSQKAASKTLSAARDSLNFLGGGESARFNCFDCIFVIVLA